METRYIYRGSEFLGECTRDQARTLLLQGQLLPSDEAGDDGENVRSWVAWGDEPGALPRPPALPPSWRIADQEDNTADYADLPRPPALPPPAGRGILLPLPGMTSAKPRSTFRRDVLMAGLGAAGGGLLVKLLGGQTPSSGDTVHHQSSQPARGNSRGFNISESLLRRSIVQVDIRAQPSGFGTGFCLARTGQPDYSVIASASHVVDHGRLNALTGNPRLAAARTWNGAETPLLPPWTWEKDLDTCAFTTQLDLEPLPLARELPGIGEYVVAVGFLGEGLVSAGGIVTGYKYEGVPRIETSIATMPGYSGGPLLNRNGEVVGMAVTRSTNGVISSRSVPLHELRNLAERVDFMQRVRESG